MKCLGFSKTSKPFLLLTLFLGLFGCEDSVSSYQRRLRRHNEIAEPLLRTKNDQTYTLLSPKTVHLPPYPWENRQPWHHITQEHFRCKGKRDNPPIIKEDSQGRMQRIADCNGPAHSLPLVDDEEHIYPILIELLNHLQDKTGRPVIITCGHRCPTHNSYADDSVSARTSKHQIGAEVDFYIQGMEEDPETVIALILAYYQERYPNTPVMRDFQRYSKEKTDVATQPWYNREIFIKKFSAAEGRDFDNRHSHPYIGIQVRWDSKRSKGVAYSWPKAHRGYLRD